MRPTTFLLLLAAFPFFSAAQTNIVCTNPEAEQILLGNFDPADYAAAIVLDAPDLIAARLQTDIHPDSLKSYITRLSQFGTRNTGADTLSNTAGYGAARRWVYAKLQEFSAQHENRLLVSNLQFDQDICGMDATATYSLCCPVPTRPTTASFYWKVIWIAGAMGFAMSSVPQKAWRTTPAAWPW